MTVGSFETSAPLYQTTRPHSSERSNHHSHYLQYVTRQAMYIYMW